MPDLWHGRGRLEATRRAVLHRSSHGQQLLALARQPQASQRAGIRDLRWHGLRHGWASGHAQQGTPMAVLQELGEWGSDEMVRRYAHFSPEHLRPYACRLVGNVNDNVDRKNMAQR